MHISGAEAANWSVLLSFLVKIYAKAKLLSEGWGAWPSGLGERRKKPEAYSESDPGNGNAHGPVLYRYGNTPGDIHSFGWKTDLGSAALPKNAFPGKGIRRRAYGSLAEIFFPVYGKTAGIVYNTNNSGATGYVRNLLGFPGFLVV